MLYIHTTTLNTHAEQYCESANNERHFAYGNQRQKTRTDQQLWLVVPWDLAADGVADHLVEVGRGIAHHVEELA